MTNLQQNASIVKEQVPKFGAIVGMTNDASVVIGGKQYAAGTLRFRGFSGSLADIQEKRYDGIVAFDVVAPQSSDHSCDFSSLVEAIRPGSTIAEDQEGEDEQ